jgi:hypothetical protein
MGLFVSVWRRLAGSSLGGARDTQENPVQAGRQFRLATPRYARSHVAPVGQCLPPHKRRHRKNPESRTVFRKWIMAKISRVEVFQVDLVPKVLRSDAIQAFSKQETPMVRIWTDDALDGTGYSYTIGTGGSAVVALLRDYMAPWLLGRDAEMVEEIWKGLFFYTHANSVGATVSLALAAVDIALWDLRCKRARTTSSSRGRRATSHTDL